MLNKNKEKNRKFLTVVVESVNVIRGSLKILPYCPYLEIEDFFRNLNQGRSKGAGALAPGEGYFYFV